MTPEPSPSARNPAEIAREAELARAAAAGDGNAFASLYETYEKRIYNYCLRLLGGSSDAEDATQEAFLKVFGRLPDLDGEQINFGAYLFTAARNASYDMIDRRKRTEPVADLPDDGSGHLHRERADLDIEPERAAMLSDQQAALRAANERLPARQREVLVLREVEGMSYAEIATTMEMNSNSVAQLISRARTSLRGELRVGVASAVTPASADCERALPLMAMKHDGELADPVERGWLATHLSDCSGCRLSSEEMAEAGISYRVWAPVAPGLYLFRDTLAKASEIVGADWSDVLRPGGESGPPVGDARGSGSNGRAPRSRRMAVSVAAGVALLSVLGAALMAGTIGDSSLDPAERSRPASAKAADDPRDAGDGSGKRDRNDGQPAGDAPLPASGGTPLGDQPSPAVSTGGDGGSSAVDNGASPAGGGSSGGGSTGGSPGGGTGSSPTPNPNPTPDPTPTPRPDPPTRPVPTPPTPPTPGGPGPTTPNPPPTPGGPGGFTSGS